jgi:hypothetical protein
MNKLLLIFFKLHSHHITLKRELPNALHLRVIPEHDVRLGVLWSVSSSDQGNDVGSVEHLHYSNSSIEIYSTIIYINSLPLLNVVLKGRVLYILKPFVVPQAKQLASWLKPRKRIYSLSLVFILYIECF